MEGKQWRYAKGSNLDVFLVLQIIFFYRGDTGFSQTACQWIKAENDKLGKHIHHKMCGHGGERRVMVMIEDGEGKKKPHFYPVDGYEPETKTVYQYHGCKQKGHTCLESRTSRQKKR